MLDICLHMLPVGPWISHCHGLRLHEKVTWHLATPKESEAFREIWSGNKIGENENNCKTKCALNTKDSVLLILYLLQWIFQI